MDDTNRQVLENLQKKYGELVWFARRGPESMKMDLVKNRCHQIMEDHPIECELLWSEDDGDWQHGFHSGCYAILNMILTHDDMLDAFDDFPQLDT